MDIITQYPGEWAYLWLILQAYWLVKLRPQPLNILGFAFSHAAFLWFLLAFRQDMAPLLGWHGHTSDNVPSSYSLIFLAWLALAVVYLARVLLLPRKTRQSRSPAHARANHPEQKN